MSLSDKFSEESLVAQQELEDLRAALVRSQRDLRRAKAKTDALVEATLQAASDAVLGNYPPKVPAKPKKPSKASSEAAIWHLTDWQGAKLTPSYNSEVMWERVRRFVDKAEKITDMQSHPINECHILFGGDMIEGLFNFPTQPFEIDATLFEQFVNVANLMVEVVTRALEIYNCHGGQRVG